MVSDERIVTVAVENAGVRQHFVQLLKEAGYEVVVASLHDLVEGNLAHQVTILEANDDVAALCQTVYGLYAAYPTPYTLPIIALIGKDALERSPRLGGWEVAGHAAVSALVPYKDRIDPDDDRGILEMVRRLAGAYPKKPQTSD